MEITGFSLVDFNGEAVGVGVLGLLLYDGGTVCDDFFSATSADAICREMVDFGQRSYISGRRWSIQSCLNITLDDVVCNSGNWSSNCSFNLTHDCVHGEDIFLQCGPG